MKLKFKAVRCGWGISTYPIIEGDKDYLYQLISHLASHISNRTGPLPPSLYLKISRISLL